MQIPARFQRMRPQLIFLTLFTPLAFIFLSLVFFINIARAAYGIPCECATKAECPAGMVCDTTTKCDPPAATPGWRGLCQPPPVCIDTPIGCIPTDLGEATAYLFGVVVNILAALAIIVFIAGGVQAMASGDSPEGLQEGKNKMTAAVSGFFLLLLFVVIIHMIGIRMLGISVLEHVIRPWYP